MNDFEIRSKLRSVYYELSEKYHFYCSCSLKIVISKRLRSCNGYCQTERIWNEIITVKIVMSRALLEEFGWERFEKTFRHEVAHLADIILYNGKGHSHSFKRLCEAFGGSMNKKIAGYKYSKCADTAYVKSIIKWIYTCPCGYQKKISKRMNERKRNNSNYRCGKCRKYTLDTWEENRVG